MSELRGKALRGSPQAACRVAQELWRCSTVSSDLEMASVLSDVPAAGVLGAKKSFSEILLDQSDANSERCRYISKDEVVEAYSFQKISADKGDSRYERWLVLSPMIQRGRFLDEIENWLDYKKRAERYVDTALKRRNFDDLQVLLAIYSPVDSGGVSPPFRISDNATFLALVKAAKENGLEMPVHVAQSAGILEGQVSREDALVYANRASEIAGKWEKGRKEGGVAHVLAGQDEVSFCQNYGEGYQ